MSNALFSEYKKDFIKRTKDNEFHQQRQYYAKIIDTLSVIENTVFIEVRDGKSLTDSPFRILLELLKRDETRFAYSLVYADENLDEFRAELDYWLEKYDIRQAKISFVKRNTEEYQQKLITSEWLLTNSTLVEHYIKQPNQKLINTWHGTPIKFMGFKIKDSLAASKNVLRNLLFSDYILSPSPFFTNVLATDYKLKGLYAGEILEAGYPRIDVERSTLRKDVETLLTEKFGLTLDASKKNIFYTPTWKGTNVNGSVETRNKLVAEYQKLHKELSNEYNIFIKVHPFDYLAVQGDEQLKNVLIPDVIDANFLLNMCDCLITDYSSIFFDYLKFNRPLVFYAWDEDLYTAERGLYIDTKTLPGNIAHDLDELIAYVKTSDTWATEFAEEINAFKELYLPKEDGEATKRVVDYIFYGKKDERLEVVKVDAREKTKLLLYPGGMRSNGITSSALNLLKTIDYTKYDVTLLSPMPNFYNKANLMKVPDEVRLLFRFSEGLYTQEEAFKDFLTYKVDLNTDLENNAHFYRREVARITAGQEFDVAVDFSGYSFYFAKYLIYARTSKRVVFQHNDMWADGNREVKGEKPMLTDVMGLIHVYHKFDKIVSVSPSTMALNKKKLAVFLSEETLEKFSFARNTMDVDRLLYAPEREQKENAVKISANQALLSSDLELSAELPLESDIKRISKLTKFIDIQSVRCYKQLSDVQALQYTTIPVHSTDVVEVVAEQENGLNHWSKINVNNVYLGWVHSGFLIPYGRIAESYKKQSKVGSVIQPRAYKVWKFDELIKEATAVHPVKIKEEFFYPLSEIKGQYVKIKGAVKTDLGEMYHIQTMMAENVIDGLVQERALSNVHNLVSSMNPLWQVFEQKNRNRKFNRDFIPVDFLSYTYRYVAKYHGQVVFRGKEAVEHQLIKGVTYPIRHIFTAVDGKKYGYVMFGGKAQGYMEVDQLEDVTHMENERFDYPFSEVYPLLKEKKEIFKREEGKIYFVTMGRLSPEKNQKTLIQATKALVDEGIQNIQVDMLGEGPLKAELEALIEELNLGDYVHLLGQKNNPFDYLKERDVFILPSLWEGQPMVLLESLSLGVKTVASNIDSSAYVLENNGRKYGLLSDGQDVLAIADLMKKSMDFDNFEGLDRFDVNSYNQEAMEDFTKIVEE
ncbi:MAG: CDP-glycerol glycerophosphotransferase family protein [Streptococcaceae bacterium]|nr:CDP-glycerol glycerophosphotransferase family protein [Streptococcaceae bacterium]